MGGLWMMNRGEVAEGDMVGARREVLRGGSGLS